MEIVWLDLLFEGNVTDIERDQERVRVWISENEAEFHKLLHLAEEMEVEVIRVIEGEQEVDTAGVITLRTLELHFMSNIVLVLRSEEVQQRGSPKTSKATVQLGYVIPPAKEIHATPVEVTKKEIN